MTFTVAPRVAAFGASELRVGFTGAGAETVKDWAALVPALVVTVTV
jgi:hypothetical protein